MNYAKYLPLTVICQEAILKNILKDMRKRKNNIKKQFLIGGSKRSYQKLADLYKNKMKQPDKAKKF